MPFLGELRLVGVSLDPGMDCNRLPCGSCLLGCTRPRADFKTLFPTPVPVPPSVASSLSIAT